MNKRDSLPGYRSEEPCIVCQALTGHNVIEPRFGYVVCPTHADVPPTKIDEAKKEYEAEKRNA